MEFETVKEAIQFMLELSEKGATMKTNGVDSTIDDYKEMYRETLYSMCDLLGMQDLYLEPSEDEGADQMQPILAVLVACLVYIVVFVGVSWAKDKFNDWSDNDDKDD